MPETGYARRSCRATTSSCLAPIRAQPLTNKSTTPSTVAVLKFSSRTDGTYETAAAKGHYSFDPKTKTLTWLDGPHERTLTKTELGDRENGAPKIGLVLNGQSYGCFSLEIAALRRREPHLPRPFRADGPFTATGHGGTDA